MKILVAGSIQGDGGYEEAALCGLIAAELRAAGHTADHFMLPSGGLIAHTRRGLLTGESAVLVF